MRLVAVVMVMLLGASVQASAQDKMVFGQGLNSCGEARQTKSYNQGLSVQWVAGYLSGMNMEPLAPNALAGTDFDGLMAWVDNYCRSNPLEPIVFAASALMKELRSRAH